MSLSVINNKALEQCRKETDNQKSKDFPLIQITSA